MHGLPLCSYGSHWKVSEAEKNLLRTHTTAVSSRMLYRLAQVPLWVLPSRRQRAVMLPTLSLGCGDASAI